MRIAQFGDLAVAGSIKAGGRKDQDRGIDQQRKHQRHRAVDGGKAQRLPLFGQGIPVVARLDDGGMQIQVVRHHRGPKDAQRQIEHRRVGHDFSRRRKTPDHRPPFRVRHGDLNAKAHGNDPQQHDDERLEPAEAFGLQPQDQEYVQRRDDDADFQRNAEQQVQADGGADHFGNVGGDDGKLCQEPKRDADPARIGIAAGLRQITPRSDGKPGAKRLQYDGHDVGHQRDEQQRIAKGRPAGQAGGPVARVHIAHRNHVARPDKGEKLAPARFRHRHRPVHIGQSRIAAPVAPVSGRLGTGTDVTDAELVLHVSQS